MEFLSQRGSVTSIMLACFEGAVNYSMWVGHGEFEMTYGGDNALPKFRNDHGEGTV